jgi:hypothetical protein
MLKKVYYIAQFDLEPTQKISNLGKTAENGQQASRFSAKAVTIQL